jgi:soluble lytic murein transglycosylase-like protein
MSRASAAEFPSSRAPVPVVVWATCALLALGCARESFAPGLAPTRPTAAAPYSGPEWRAPHLPAQLPPPVGPYKWPEPSQLSSRVPVPTWAGPNALPFAGAVQRAALFYQLPPALLWAVIKVESNFRHRAVSRAGARGLMQLMPATASSMGLRDALDPEQNILCGAYYLRRLANRYAGDLYFTLAAYNAGPVAVERHRGVPPFRETESYVRQVLTYYWSTLPAPAPL